RGMTDPDALPIIEESRQKDHDNQQDEIHDEAVNRLESGKVTVKEEAVEHPSSLVEVKLENLETDYDDMHSMEISAARPTNLMLDDDEKASVRDVTMEVEDETATMDLHAVKDEEPLEVDPLYESVFDEECYRKPVAKSEECDEATSDRSVDSDEDFKVAENECEICGKTMKYKSSLKHHMRLHERNEKARRPFPCNICGQRFSQPGNLKIHQRTHLEDEKAKQLFKCKICGKGVNTNQSLQYHMRSHHDKAERNFECEDCGKRFGQSSHLSTHRKTHFFDEADRRPYKCDLCEKRFTQTSHLTSHKLSHLGEDDPKLEEIKQRNKCKICGDELKNPRNLRIHMRSHSDDEKTRRPFKCDVCGVRCTQASSLKVHKKIHLKDDDPLKGHECDICGKVIRGALTNLRKHQKTHAKDKVQSVRKRFKCDLCAKVFATAQSLTRHKLTHADEVNAKDPIKSEACSDDSQIDDDYDYSQEEKAIA
ncbi:hypothetical protein PENTCL1PPCAC_29800, partial [Pristionchus entomophagus]